MGIPVGIPVVFLMEISMEKSMDFWMDFSITTCPCGNAVVRLLWRLIE